MSSFIPQWDTTATHHPIHDMESAPYNIMVFLPSSRLHQFSFYTSFLVESSSLRTREENIFAWNSEIFSVFETKGREAAENFLDDLLCMGCRPDSFLRDILRLLTNSDFNMQFPDLSSAINADVTGLPGPF